MTLFLLVGLTYGFDVLRFDVLRFDVLRDIKYRKDGCENLCRILAGTKPREA